VIEESKRRLLAIFAHPDDESFGPGGTLAFYARQGVEIHLICATRGEAGKIPDSLNDGSKTVAELREAELRCAASVLGLKKIYFLDFRDSGMAGTPDNHHPNALSVAPVEDVAAKITQLIRQIKPQVIITHDPKGGYHHPDHIAIHKATVEAFHASNDPDRFKNDLPPYSPQKLYFTTHSLKFVRLIVRFLPLFGIDPRHFGKNQDIDLLELVKVEYPIHARINIRSVQEIKERASACHASQLDHGFRRQGIAGWIFKLVSRNETFTRAYPPDPPKPLERDLFKDIVP
jgi:LmbE family N-acetylglucosaminyl deacetylase